MRRFDLIARALPLRVRQSHYPSLSFTVLRAELRANLKIYVAWLVWFVAFVLLVRSTLGGPDGTRYTSYLRSLVFDHDLLLMNELQHYGQRIIITSTGYAAQIANVGVIPFWLPFYLLGVLAAWLHGGIGSGLAMNYALWLDFGDWVYGLLALVVMYRWACTRFTRRTALIATLLVAFGSSFIYYATALAPSYHTISALLCALYLYLWHTTRARRTSRQWFGLGLLLGLLMSVAQYHAVLGVFLIFDFRLVISSLNPNFKIIDQKWLLTVCAVALGVFLPLLPQLVAWWITLGSPLANPYTLESNWSGAHLLDVLFSSYHGLYFTAPILLVATLGWLVGFNRERALYGGALIALLAIAYSSATRIGWWAGVSFGARYFIGLTPLFVMGFAELIESRGWRRVTKRVSSLSSLVAKPAILFGIFCALWSYGYFLQAFGALTSFSEYHSARQWISYQAIVLRRLPELLAAHWLAPRAPFLMDSLLLFGLSSLVVVRLGARWLLDGGMGRQARWLVVLACVPAAFALFLLSTIPSGEAHKRELAESGYYEQNLARAENDFEQFSNEYVERARYDDALGQSDAARSDMQRALALWNVHTRALVIEGDAGQFQSLAVQFGDALQLVGYRIEGVGDDARADARPIVVDDCATRLATCTLRVRLLWRATERLSADYDVGVLLLDTSGQVVARTSPARGLDPFPMTWWLPKTLMSDEQEIPLSALPTPSLLRLRVEVFDAQANKRLPASVNNGIITELKRAPDTMPSSKDVFATLAGQASLLEYRLVREAGGASLALTWRADTAISTDYTVFVHLLDAQNRIIAQGDAQPLAGRYPTHAWARGEVIYDVHAIALSADSLARLDHIAVGMYTLSDGGRLSSSSGGDAIMLRGFAP